MKKSFITLLEILVVSVIVFSCASGWGRIRYTHTGTFIRVKPSPNAKVISRLQPGQKIRVDFRKGDWYAVFKMDETVRDPNNAIGYIYAPHLNKKPYKPSAIKRQKPVKPLRPPK